MAIVSGNAQVDTVGQELPQPLVVRVLDADDEPVPQQVVNFRLLAGGGSVFAGVAFTDSAGEARERWTLGTVAADSQAVEARAVDTQTGEALVFATFTAVAIPDEAVSIMIAAATAADSATLARRTVGIGDSLRLVAAAEDQYGNESANITPAWHSTIPEVATVTAAGVVHALASGTTEIVAEAGSGADTLAITVGLALLGFYDASIQVDRLVLSNDGTKLYVGGWNGEPYTGEGFQILDVSDPVSPQHLGGLERAVHVIRLSPDNLTAYVGGIGDGLLIINVSSSSSPTLIGRYETSSNNINDVAISPDGNTAYVAGGDDGLLIVNISNPASPSLLSSYSVSDNCTIDGQPVFEGNCSAGGVTLSGDGQIAYVAAAWGGIQILDVSQPDTPVLVGTMEAGVSLIGKLILSGDELIGYSIGSGGVGGQPFRILGLTDRTSPTVIGTFITDLGGYGAIELSTDGTRIYLGGINIGFSILDVSDPTSPSLQATFFEIIDERAPNVAGLDVTTDGSVAYLATVVDGVRIVDLSSLNSATVGAPPR